MARITWLIAINGWCLHIFFELLTIRQLFHRRKHSPIAMALHSLSFFHSILIYIVVLSRALWFVAVWMWELRCGVIGHSLLNLIIGWRIMILRIGSIHITFNDDLVLVTSRRVISWVKCLTLLNWLFYFF